MYYVLFIFVSLSTPKIQTQLSLCQCICLHYVSLSFTMYTGRLVISFHN